MRTFSHEYFKSLEKRMSCTLDRVENKITDYLDVSEYIMNPSYYYSDCIINDENITFVIETITENDKKINIITPIKKVKDHIYHNSSRNLHPILFKNNVRNCVNCLGNIRPRKDNKKNFAGRLGCVACSLDVDRDKPTRIYKCDYLG